MATLQYMSDLHLERIKYDFTITKVAPILVLAGDIGRFCDYDLYRDFLARQCMPSQFDLVLLVAGNHEFYGSSRETGLAAAEKLTREPSMYGKLRFLNRSRVDLPGCHTTVLGCTLHSHIAAGYTKLTNDFARIQEWSVKSHNTEHEIDRAWLKESLLNLKQDDPRRRVIVVTHYAPLFEGVCHPQNENNAVSQCFSSNALEDVQRANLLTSSWSSCTYWIYGHTHWNAKLKRGKSVVLSNQLCTDDKNLSWWQRKRLFRPFNTNATIST